MAQELDHQWHRGVPGEERQQLGLRGDHVGEAGAAGAGFPVAALDQAVGGGDEARERFRRDRVAHD